MAVGELSSQLHPFESNRLCFGHFIIQAASLASGLDDPSPSALMPVGERSSKLLVWQIPYNSLSFVPSQKHLPGFFCPGGRQ